MSHRQNIKLVKHRWLASREENLLGKVVVEVLAWFWGSWPDN
jgi:hypothetical protein